MEAVRTSETSVSLYRTTLRHVPEFFLPPQESWREKQRIEEEKEEG
jgi:hypothetical protein